MSFLAMMTALALFHAWGSGEPVQQDDWFCRWQSRVGSWGLLPAVTLAFAVLAPALLAGLILDALRPALFGLLWFGGAVVVLLYALGRGDYRATRERYRRYCREGDFEAAWIAADAEWDLVSADASPGSPGEVHREIQSGLFYEGYQRWFAPLFYFLLLGPVGALAYRLLQLCRGRLAPALCARVLHLLDWVPVRVLAAVFTITGDFVASRDELLASLADFDSDAGSTLSAVGGAAMGGRRPGDGDEDLGGAAAAWDRSAEELLTRSAGAWLIAISLLVLFGP
mgnify:CR=1 FL=1